MAHRGSRFAVLAIWVLAAAPSFAQVPEQIVFQPGLTGSSPEEQLLLDRTIDNGPETYGTLDSIIHQIPVAAFTPYGCCDNHFLPGADLYAHLSMSGGSAFAPVNLPNGAQIRFLDIWYYDTSFMGDAQVTLHRSCGHDPPVTTLLGSVDSSGSDNGYGYKFQLLSPLPTVANTCQYVVYVTGLSQDSALQLRRIKAVDLWYKLRVSPAPATATFGDVPTNHWAFQFVEALVASGITSGCGGGNYCPDDSLTRAQMAVFLAKALGLHWPG